MPLHWTDKRIAVTCMIPALEMMPLLANNVRGQGKMQSSWKEALLGTALSEPTHALATKRIPGRRVGDQRQHNLVKVDRCCLPLSVKSHFQQLL